MTLHKQRGVAAVELALIIVPMLILCFGITEVGRALYYYNGLVKATRSAVRYLAAYPPAGATADSTRLEARSLALCGQKVCSGNDELVPGLTLAQISVCDPLSCSSTHSNIPTATGMGSVNLVTVTIGGTNACSSQNTNAYCFTSLLPGVIPSFRFAPVKTTMAAQFF